MIEPGVIRFRGEGAPYLTGTDVHPEVLCPDGTWMPLRGVCGAVLKIDAQSIVTAVVQVELGALDLGGIAPEKVLWYDSRNRPWWKRLLFHIAR